MQLREIKNMYMTSLMAVYGQEREVESIFYVCLEHICGMKRYEYAIRCDDELNEAEGLKMTKALDLLMEGRPVQQVLGTAYFYGRDFVVNEDVLIPRPETEELVQWILSEQNPSGALRVLDVGVGSGAICLTLAAERPEWEVQGVDVSSEALQVASKNAQGIAPKVILNQCDILDADAREAFGEYDVIVSNPPYVRESERAEMRANVLEWEPSLALYVSDEDPLIFYRNIAEFASSHLSFGGSLYFEINEYLGAEMMDMLRAMGYVDLSLRKDINGRDRMLRAVKI